MRLTTIITTVAFSLSAISIPVLAAPFGTSDPSLVERDTDKHQWSKRELMSEFVGRGDSEVLLTREHLESLERRDDHILSNLARREPSSEEGLERRERITSFRGLNKGPGSGYRQGFNGLPSGGRRIKLEDNAELVARSAEYEELSRRQPSFKSFFKKIGKGLGKAFKTVASVVLRKRSDEGDARLLARSVGSGVLSRRDPNTELNRRQPSFKSFFKKIGKGLGKAFKTVASVVLRKKRDDASAESLVARSAELEPSLRREVFDIFEARDI